ncbi:Cro/CI family transcriptional regulator [Pseudomonas oryzihabitans]|uniref:Cro/CI family transcriptional regulator n=1 Tax=Pseudomonas oryzihabitans TaxID=47885 RepID=UPI00241C7822|nr:Cro/CI family transcriptional regulator [Pseudomonas oryzihabitans]
MHPVTLAQYVADQSQESASKRLGLSQAAISKAIKAGRTIYVFASETGSTLAVELKAFPAGSSNHPESMEEILAAIPSARNRSNSAVISSSAAEAMA